MTTDEYGAIISVEDYLAGELENATKHELVEGQVIAMAGASVNHERIAVNFSAELYNRLKNSPCEPFGSDMKVRVRDNFYYPDLLVDCSFDEAEPYYTTSPVIIVEVLSRSTRKMDEKTKLIEYFNIPTLQEYVLIEQDIADVTVYRRQEGWRSTHYFLGESVYFESIDCTIAVEDIYRRVKNEDVDSYFAQKSVDAQKEVGV